MLCELFLLLRDLAHCSKLRLVSLDSLRFTLPAGPWGDTSPRSQGCLAPSICTPPSLPSCGGGAESQPAFKFRLSHKCSVAWSFAWKLSPNRPLCRRDSRARVKLAGLSARIWLSRSTTCFPYSESPILVEMAKIDF
jgi:hypothetical protein